MNKRDYRVFITSQNLIENVYKASSKQRINKSKDVVDSFFAVLGFPQLSSSTAMGYQLTHLEIARHVNFSKFIGWKKPIDIKLRNIWSQYELLEKRGRGLDSVLVFLLFLWWDVTAVMQ